MDTFLDQIQQTSLVEWLGTATGLAGVYLSIKEKSLAWPFFIICYALYVYLSFSAGLYAALALNACFIPISIYGWWKWSRASGASPQTGESTPELRITRLRGTELAATIAIALGGTMVIGNLLSRHAESAAPFLEAFATTLSFLAQWMLGRKYLENWLAWIAGDLAFVILWGSQGYWLAVAMFLVFTVLATLGFLSWRKEMNSDGR